MPGYRDAPSRAIEDDINTQRVGKLSLERLFSIWHAFSFVHRSLEWASKSFIGAFVHRFTFQRSHG